MYMFKDETRKMGYGLEYFFHRAFLTYNESFMTTQTQAFYLDE